GTPGPGRGCSRSGPPPGGIPAVRDRLRPPARRRRGLVETPFRRCRAARFAAAACPTPPTRERGRHAIRAGWGKRSPVGPKASPHCDRLLPLPSPGRQRTAVFPVFAGWRPAADETPERGGSRLSNAGTGAAPGGTRAPPPLVAPRAATGFLL